MPQQWARPSTAACPRDEHRSEPCACVLRARGVIEVGGIASYCCTPPCDSTRASAELAATFHQFTDAFDKFATQADGSTSSRREPATIDVHRALDRRDLVFTSQRFQSDHVELVLRRRELAFFAGAQALHSADFTLGRGDFAFMSRDSALMRHRFALLSARSAIDRHEPAKRRGQFIAPRRERTTQRRPSTPQRTQSTTMRAHSTAVRIDSTHHRAKSTSVRRESTPHRVESAPHDADLTPTLRE